jgi:peptidoglycan hydrolase-like protein with peptidoglycan-binding domain
MADHPTIKQGSKGPAVKLAQQRLNARGYTIARDGIFGPQTKLRVSSYQSDRSSGTIAPLKVDGIVGPSTWARLDPPTIKRGAKGAAVKLLQERLDVYDVIADVAIDGDFGPATEKALKAFQEWWGTLTVDGIAGPLTWTALWS